MYIRENNGEELSIHGGKERLLTGRRVGLRLFMRSRAMETSLEKFRNRWQNCKYVERDPYPPREIGAGEEPREDDALYNCKIKKGKGFGNTSCIERNGCPYFEPKN